jgi:hypothetical protein
MLAIIRCRILSSSLSQNIKNKIYRTIILPVVLYAFETWSLTLKEEHGLRVFENRTLRRIFGPKRDEITGEWRKLHEKEMYSSPYIIRAIKSRIIRWAGHVARLGRAEVHTGFSSGNLRESDHLEDRGVYGWITLRWIFRQWDGGMDWIDQSQDRERWRV